MRLTLQFHKLLRYLTFSVLFLLILLKPTSPSLAQSESPGDLSVPLTEPVTTTLYLPAILRMEPPPPPPVPTDHLFCASPGSPIYIPDNDIHGINHSLHVTDTRLIVDLDVYLRIDHPLINEVVVKLTHQDTATQIRLVERPGIPNSLDGCRRGNLIAILDDEASQPVEGKCAASNPTISGSFQPNEPLSKFTGQSFAGRWILNISDREYGNMGQLNQWCLDVTLGEVLPPPRPKPDPSTLPASASISGISGRNQALPLDCESRSAVDWAAYFGVYIPEFEFFYNLPKSDNPDAGFVGDVYGAWGQIPPNPYGVHAEPVAHLLRSYGLNAHAHRYLSWDELRAEVAAGRPVEVWVIGSSNGILPGRYYPVYYQATGGHISVVSPFEHTAILIGYTPDRVTLLDGGTIYTRTLSQFLDSWSVLRNMAVLGRE